MVGIGSLVISAPGVVGWNLCVAKSKRNLDRFFLCHFLRYDSDPTYPAHLWNRRAYPGIEVHIADDLVSDS